MDQQFQCSHCEKQFKKIGKLNRHVNETHLNVFKYNCSQCNTQFKRQQHLSRHEKTHSEIRQFQCEYEGCPQSFFLKHHLKRHIEAMHQKILKFFCECQFSTHLKKIYNKHRASCQMILKDQEIEKAHVHEKKKEKIPTSKKQHDKLFVCREDNCLKSFTRKRNLRKHFEVQHRQIKSFQCDQCKNTYAHKCTLQKHVCKLMAHENQNEEKPINENKDQEIFIEA